MKMISSVEQYILEHENWSREISTLREIIKLSSLEENIKWGSPVYSFQGKNLIGLGALKSYVVLIFFQGALLKDQKNVLINAQENKTKALRQWRFTSAEEIRDASEAIRSYIGEAIKYQKQGKEIKPDSDKPLIIPPELKEILSADIKLNQCFTALSKFKLREYSEYISEAKREETKTKRLEKIIPMIMAGVGLNDKYRK